MIILYRNNERLERRYKVSSSRSGSLRDFIIGAGSNVFFLLDIDFCGVLSCI
jgi:hypothetical protein